MEDLQSSALPLGYGAILATAGVARLAPRRTQDYHCLTRRVKRRDGLKHIRLCQPGDSRLAQQVHQRVSVSAAAQKVKSNGESYSLPPMVSVTTPETGVPSGTGFGEKVRQISPLAVAACSMLLNSSV